MPNLLASYCSKDSAPEDRSRTSSPHPERKRKEKEDEELNTKIATILQKMDNEEDQDSIFGKYIAGELRQINDPRIKLKLKMSITNEIGKARLDMLSEMSEY